MQSLQHRPRSPAAWNAITIRHLLTHTSGLAREVPGFDARKTQADGDLIRTAYPERLRFTPGEKFEYGNLSYFILAEIIQQASGRPWTEYLGEKVFTPAGMTATFPTNTSMDLPQRARGYVDNDELRDAPEWPALRPSGAFLSTVLDLAKWDAALYTEKILTASTRQQMWTPITLKDGTAAPYGFGWYVGSLHGRGVVHHSGGMPGVRWALVRSPEDGLTIIVLMNLDDVDKDSIVNGIARIYLASAK